jgi:N-methylhydantoinase B/oxoprolinase/acetone carboxylase alpha subunit
MVDNVLAAGEAGSGRTDPLLMNVLSKRFNAIVREMTTSVRKSSRSTAVTNGRDMSCGLLTYDHRLICTEEGMPIHVMGLDITTRPISELFDDVREGDAFINNCSFTGGTQHRSQSRLYTLSSLP